MEKKTFKNDVAVLLIFFSRPGCFRKVFEQVKRARPKQLFLYQDGPRKGNEKDFIGINQCRQIAEDIDWECEVHKFYQEENFGCDPSEFIAQKWAFSHVDRCIILEDDDVPTQSFFPFCVELLEKYADDQRINMICGMNNLESVSSPYSYIFTQTGSIWGWATWKRVIDEWESNYGILDDEFNMKKLKQSLFARDLFTSKRLKIWRNNKDSGVEHYETINGLNQYSQSRLNIVPVKNMIINIGNTPEGSTHSESDILLLPKALRRIYTMKSYEIEFPLIHPKYVIDDVEYQKNVFRLMGVGHPMVSMYRNLEKCILILKKQGIKEFWKKFFQRLHRR